MYQYFYLITVGISILYMSKNVLKNILISNVKILYCIILLI